MPLYNFNIMRYFEFRHLPAHLQPMSRKFGLLAEEVNRMDVTDEDEKQVALRKLLEAKDAAIRSMLPEKED